VREALKWLVDYDAIETNIVQGTFQQHQSFLPKGFLGAITDKPYKFDVAKAKELLAKAGLPNGFTVTMDVRSTSPITDIAQAIQAGWAQAGIKLELIPGDGRATLTKYRARTHDIYIGQWGPDYLDPHTNAETFAINVDNTDDAKSKTLAWRNAWDIPEMTKVTQANVLERDADKRKAVYEALQREHQKTSPFVIMFQQIEVAAARTNAKGFSPDALAAIADWPWTGNVRELENRVKRATIMADGPTITARDLDLGDAAQPTKRSELRFARERADRLAIVEAIALNNGNLSAAARDLGISRPMLYDLMNTYGIPRG
jgi:ABC-type transport system substrate-binding protein